MSANICHDCPRRGDCLIADSASVPERCTYAIRAADAEAAYARMSEIRINRQMVARVVESIALETGQTPRQVRERIQARGRT